MDRSPTVEGAARDDDASPGRRSMEEAVGDVWEGGPEKRTGAA